MRREIAGQPPTDDDSVIRAAIEAARDQVAETSLRHVAEELGMSPTGLRGVLDGTGPNGRTRGKLRAWYLERRGLNDISAEVAEHTVLTFLRGLRDQPRGAESLLQLIEELYRSENGRIPGWIGAVRHRLMQARRHRES